MKNGFCRYWLIVDAIAVMACGAAMVLLPQPTQRAFGWLIYGDAGAIAAFGAAAAAYIALTHGVLGATMAGWGLALLLVLTGSLRRGAWPVVAASFALWLVLDTALSLYLGFWQNAALNGVIALAFAIPLAATFVRMRTAVATLAEPADNALNLMYFDAETMPTLFAKMDAWQKANRKRLQSVSIEKDADAFCCIALTNPGEVIIVNGSDDRRQVGVRRGRLQVEMD